MTPTLANFIKRFFSHYLPVQKGLAVNTIMAYRDAIKLLLCYASDTLNKNVEELGVEEIDESLVLGFPRSCGKHTRLQPQNPQCQTGSNPRPLRLHGPGGTLSVAPLPRPSAPSPSNAPSTKPSTTSKKTKCRPCSTRWTSTRVPECGTKPCCCCSTIPGLGSAKSCNSKWQTYASMAPLKSSSWARARNIEVVPCGPKRSRLSSDYLKQRTAKDPAAQQLFLNANGSPLTRFGVRLHHRQIRHHSQKPMPIPRCQNRQPPHHPPYHRHASAAGR